MTKERDPEAILGDTFCIYCQLELNTPAKLQLHIVRKHKGTYAYDSVQTALELRRKRTAKEGQ